MAIPTIMKALRQEEPNEPFNLTEVPVPAVTPGNAIVQILAGTVNSYSRELWDGTRGLIYPTPITPGPFGIGRIIGLGPDSTNLSVGQLVYLDAVVHSRDDPNHIILASFLSGTSPKLMDYWKDGVFAQCKAHPLESVFPLNESHLKTLGYSIEDLAVIGRMNVPFGGLKDAGLQPGETVIIAPATGGFGITAVHLAVSLGARVIAMGRNTSILKKLEDRYPGKIVAITMASTVEDNLKGIQEACSTLNGSVTRNQPDVFFDISPSFASGSTHIPAGLMALKRKGRVSLMGGVENVTLPYLMIMFKNLTIRGKWMYERHEIEDLIRLVELGIVQIGEKSSFGKAHTFGLEQWKEAFDFAATSEESAVIVP